MTPFTRLCEDVFRRHDARGIIVITRPAKTTALRASSRYLDKQPVTHFGFRRPYRRRGAESILTEKELGEFGLSAFHRSSERAFFRVYRCQRTSNTTRYAGLVRDVIKD